MGIVHDANQAAMRFLAERIGVVRRGRNGSRGEETAELPWMSFSHTTARPTVDLARVDRATGETYTDTVEVPLRHPDMLLHHHNAVPNVLLSEQSDHIGSIDGNRLKGNIKVAGAVYQAYIARGAREHGIAVSFDPDTGSARLDAIPRSVERHYSKRTEEGGTTPSGWPPISSEKAGSRRTGPTCRQTSRPRSSRAKPRSTAARRTKAKTRPAIAPNGSARRTRSVTATTACCVRDRSPRSRNPRSATNTPTTSAAKCSTKRCRSRRCCPPTGCGKSPPAR